MRGKDANGLNMLSNLGITPAYAGKRPSRLRRDHERRDHPRVCGEKQPQRVKVCKVIGSPPRMRGKVIDDYLVSILDRITPAYAGKSLPFASPAVQLRDHPRVCGEKLTYDDDHVPGMRITPAYAGKSGCHRALASYSRDHPRVCGEKMVEGKEEIARTGSPPRMRGKAGAHLQILARSGITPAYAGKRTLDFWHYADN